MVGTPEDEVSDILDMQQRIQRRLDDLKFADTQAQGAIIHHLAEVAVLGRKLADTSLPRFLSLPVQQAEKLADLAVDIQTDLDEIKEAIVDMEDGLLKLVNFLNS